MPPNHDVDIDKYKLISDTKIVIHVQSGTQSIQISLALEPYVEIVDNIGITRMIQQNQLRSFLEYL